MDNKERAASDVLEGVVRDNQADHISFLEIKTALHERGFGLLMIFFALPVAILPPGLAGLPSIPLIIFAIQMMRGADSPWMPKWIEKKTIKRETIALFVEKGSPYLKKAERLLRPRFFFVSSEGGEKIIGLLSLIFSISILIPLPFTNFLPAMGILLMSLGLLSKDGILIIIGMIVGSAGICMTTLVIFLGKKAAMAVIYQIMGI